MVTTKGIFTTIKVVNGIPFFLEYHLIRLGIEEKKDFVRKQIKNVIPDLIGNLDSPVKLENDNKKRVMSAAVRVSILEDGTLLFDVRPLPESSIVSAITIESAQKLPTTKQIDRSIYTKAKEQALKMHAQEAIFIEKNDLLETTIANLVSEDSSGNLITPKLTKQGLQGITRQLLLDKGYITQKDIPISTHGPLVAINCLRVIGIEKLNNTTLTDLLPLMKKVQAILKKEEESYANSYYR